jgi:hypothetical protein
MRPTTCYNGGREGWYNCLYVSIRVRTVELPQYGEYIIPKGSTIIMNNCTDVSGISPLLADMHVGLALSRGNIS